MILITGAAGKTGQAILMQLAKLRSEAIPVRALVRRDEQCIVAKGLGATDVIVGDLRSRADLAKALDGVEVVYHICPNMQPDEVNIGQQLIAAAKSAGVQRIVYHSVLHPQTQGMPHHWNKLLVEELLLESRLGFTILQPAAYMQNVLASLDKIVADGVYQIPYATSARLGMVDLEDIAEAAVKVLLENGHNGAIYELATNEWLTQDDCAHLMGLALGQNVRAEALARSTWRENAIHVGLNEYAVETLLKMFVYYERYGFCGNATVLTALLKRSPTTFAEFLERSLASLIADS